MLRKCQSSGNVEWLCGESVEELLFFSNIPRGVQYRGTPCRTSKNVWHIGLKPSRGGGGHIFTSPITRLKIIQNPFLGDPGEGGKVGNGVYFRRSAKSE